MNKYAIEIFYSEEDDGYIAVVPELPGCSAFGDTVEEALGEVLQASDLWIETAQKEGRIIPEPQGKEFLNQLYQNISAVTCSEESHITA